GVFLAREHPAGVSEGSHGFSRQAVEALVGLSFVFEPEARAGLDLGGFAFTETMNKLPADVGLREEFLEDAGHGAHARILRIGEVHAAVGFEAYNASASATDAEHFGNDQVGIGHVHQEIASEYKVERVVGKWKLGCVTLFEVDAAVAGLSPAVRQQISVAINTGDLRFGEVISEHTGGVALPASEVQHMMNSEGRNTFEHRQSERVET